VSRFTAYTTAKPENPWGHFMLGVSSWKSGDRETAEREFRKAIELDSSMVKSRLDLSRVLLESDQPGEALDELQGALALDSTSASVYRLLGRAHEGLRETDAAIDAYHHALVLDDQDVWSMNNLALIYLEQGKIDEAVKPLARVSQLDTTTAQFWNNLGVVLERSGRFTGAAQAFTTALAIDSGYTKASVSLARVSSRTDDPSLPPLDLAAVAQSFVDEIATWKKH